MNQHIRFDVYDFGSYYMVKGTDVRNGEMTHVMCSSSEEGKVEAERRLEALTAKEVTH